MATDDDAQPPRTLIVQSAVVQIELRDLPRLKQLVWELRELESRLRVAARPEAGELERIVDRFFADITADEPEDGSG